MRDFRYIGILLAASAIIYFFGLGSMALTDPDETFYAQTAKEMLVAGDWATPHIFEKPQFEKPPMYYWLIMLSYKAFGISEFSARFPSAVFGLLCVIGVYFLGRVMYSRLVGFLSGLAMATCVECVVLARGCVTDMVLTVFILFCLLFFLTGWKTGKNIWYVLSSLMAALAVLTKGPIGLFIPGLVILAYLCAGKRWKSLPKMPIILCALIFFAVSLPWYLIALRIHGNVFLNEFFGFQNVVRFMKPEHKVFLGAFYYVPIVMAGFYPWIFFIPSGVMNVRKVTPGVEGARLFLGAWFILVFAFFTLSSTKLATYIFPLFPVLAVIAGISLENFVSNVFDKTSRACKVMNISYYALLTISVPGLLGVALFVLYDYPLAFLGTALAAAIFIAGLAVSYFFYREGKKYLTIISISGGLLLTVFPIVWWILPPIEKIESSKDLSEILKGKAFQDEAIGGESDARRGVAFYSGRAFVEDIHTNQQKAEFFSRDKRVWGVIKSKNYSDLKRDLPLRISDPIERCGKKMLITNLPVPKTE